MTEKAVIDIIPATEEHRPFIYDSFVKTCVCIHRATPGRVFSGLLRILLDSPSWKTQVATPVGEPSEILGWIVHRSPDQFGWIHVPKRYRFRGICKAMISAAGFKKYHRIESAFVNFQSIQEIGRNGWRYAWNPYLPLVVKFEAEEIERITARFMATNGG